MRFFVFLFKTIEIEERLVGTMLCTVAQKASFFKVPERFEDYIDVNNGHRASRDIRNRLRNLASNLEEGNISLEQGEGHVLFMSDEAVLNLFSDLVQIRSDIVRECINKREFVIGSGWVERLPKVVSDFVNTSSIEAISDRIAKQAVSNLSRSSMANPSDNLTVSELLLTDGCYNTQSVNDLLKFIGSLKVHPLNDLVMEPFGSTPGEAMKFFTRMFPALVTSMFVCASKMEVKGIKLIPGLMHFWCESESEICKAEPRRVLSVDEDWV